MDKKQYLNNLIEIAKFERSKMNEALKKGEDRAVWRTAVCCYVHMLSVLFLLLTVNPIRYAPIMATNNTLFYII